MRNRTAKLNMGMISVIMGLAWPTMLEQLMQTAVQYIDTAMVGSLGTEATAAVGATSTVNWLIGSTISALGIGFLAYIAKACGAGDRAAAKRAAAQAVLVVLAAGITALTLGLSSYVPVWMQVDVCIRDLAARYFFILYAPMLPRTAIIIFGTILRSAGDTKTPMKVGVMMNIINVVLNFLLIFPARTVAIWDLSIWIPGAGMGVVGAALASAIAFVFGGVYLTVVLWRHPLVSPRGESMRPDMTILRPCMKVAFPNMLQRFGTSLGYVAFASMINSLGEISTAAHTIANTVESLFYIPGYGMQTAAATLLVDIFSDSPDVIHLGSTVLRMVAVSEPFYGFSIIIEGMMLGVGKTKHPFIFNIIGMWGVRIVGTFICTQLLGFGLVASWACMIAHNLLLFILFLVSYMRGTWNPLKRITA